VLCGQLYATKAIFTLNPTIAVFQVMALKALICFSVIAVSQNTKLKYIMVDSVDQTCIPSLVFKSLQGSFGVFFTYTAIKTFQVSSINGRYRKLTNRYIWHYSYSGWRVK
jgi:hypothetical protein